MNRTQTRALLSAILLSLTLCACEGGLPTLAETGAGAGESKKGPGGLFAWQTEEPATSAKSAKGKSEDGRKAAKHSAESLKKVAGTEPSGASAQARQHSQVLTSRTTTTGRATKKSPPRTGLFRWNRRSK